FFSSRRRHTRWPRDWSSDVCSSDLIGDRGAVIASLAGDGVAIALTSGLAAAEAFLEGGPGAAGAFQGSFGRRSNRPVGIAETLRWSAERRLPRAMAMTLFAAFPRLAPLAAKLTRIG